MLQEFYHCRKEERVLNNCVFEKLVRPSLCLSPHAMILSSGVAVFLARPKD